MKRVILMATMMVLSGQAYGQTRPGGTYDTLMKSASAMTPSEIKAFNKDLADSDSRYIRCRRSIETGSLVKKVRVCKSNADWSAAFATGNQNVRDTVDAMSRAPINGSN